MKLELKQLVPYLPYGLKMYKKNKSILKASLLNLDSLLHQGYVPYLHPLSRLTEPILEGGKRIKDLGTPYDRPGSEYFELVRRVDLLKKYNTPEPNEPYQTIVGTIEHWFVEKLFEWHFDVFGLIEKGLAEPIKTSKANGE